MSKETNIAAQKKMGEIINSYQFEKLHEALFSEEEDARPTDHPMIRAVSVPALDPADLSDLRVG